MDAAAVIAEEPPEVQARVLSLDEGKRKLEVRKLREKKKSRAGKQKRVLSDETEILLMMEAVERLARSKIDPMIAAQEYASYRRPGTHERLNLAIAYLQEVAQAYLRFEHADLSGAS